jgi:hypothetical protein
LRDIDIRAFGPRDGACQVHTTYESTAWDRTDRRSRCRAG